MLTKASHEFESRKLSLHDSQMGSIMERLGVRLHGFSLHSSITRARFWKALQALTAVLRRKKNTSAMPSV